MMSVSQQRSKEHNFGFSGKRIDEILSKLRQHGRFQNESKREA